MRDAMCKECKYHSYLSGRLGERMGVACLYATYSRKGTALKVRNGDPYDLVDTRGEKGEPCKLFEAGRYERPPRFMGHREKEERE